MYNQLNFISGIKNLISLKQSRFKSNTDSVLLREEVKGLVKLPAAEVYCYTYSQQQFRYIISFNKRQLNG